jgi:hypothetical protein
VAQPGGRGTLTIISGDPIRTYPTAGTTPTRLSSAIEDTVGADTGAETALIPVPGTVVIVQRFRRERGSWHRRSASVLAGVGFELILFHITYEFMAIALLSILFFFGILIKRIASTG